MANDGLAVAGHSLPDSALEYTAPLLIAIPLSWLALRWLDVAQADFILGHSQLAIILTEPAIIRV